MSEAIIINGRYCACIYRNSITSLVDNCMSEMSERAHSTANATCHSPMASLPLMRAQEGAGVSEGGIGS